MLLLLFRMLNECQFPEKFIHLFGLNSNHFCRPYTTPLKGFLSDLELLKEMERFGSIVLFFLNDPLNLLSDRPLDTTIGLQGALQGQYSG